MTKLEKFQENLAITLRCPEDQPVSKNPDVVEQTCPKYVFAGRVSIAPDASVETIPPELPPEEESEVKWTDYMKIMKWSHMRALVWKNFLWMWRNIPVMTFIIGMKVRTQSKNFLPRFYIL